MIGSPGFAAGKQPVRLVRSELLEETGAQELELEALRQLIGLELRNDQRIGRLPGLGSIAGEEELGRERVAARKALTPSA